MNGGDCNNCKGEAITFYNQNNSRLYWWRFIIWYSYQSVFILHESSVIAEKPSIISPLWQVRIMLVLFCRSWNLLNNCIILCCVWYSVVISYAFILTNRMTNLNGNHFSFDVTSKMAAKRFLPLPLRLFQPFPPLSKKAKWRLNLSDHSNHFPPVAQPGVHIFIKHDSILFVFSAG